MADNRILLLLFFFLLCVTKNPELAGAIQTIQRIFSESYDQGLSDFVFLAPENMAFGKGKYAKSKNGQPGCCRHKEVFCPIIMC